MATETKKCPLWSDNKVLHDTELARAAKEAREKLKKANVKLDIDPLKDIPDAPAQESVEDTRTAFFLSWTALIQVLIHTRWRGKGLASVRLMRLASNILLLTSNSPLVSGPAVGAPL